MSWPRIIHRHKIQSSSVSTQLYDKTSPGINIQLISWRITFHWGSQTHHGIVCRIHGLLFLLVVLEVLPVETTSISRCFQLSPKFPETHPFYAGKETRGSGGLSDSKIYKNISCKPMAKMRCLTSIPGWLQTTEMSTTDGEQF